MKCPCCGAAELVHATSDMPFSYKGGNTTIPAVTGDFCPACGEVVLNREHGDRCSEMVSLFHLQARKIDAARASMRAGLGGDHDEVEAGFAARRARVANQA